MDLQLILSLRNIQKAQMRISDKWARKVGRRFKSDPKRLKDKSRSSSAPSGNKRKKKKRKKARLIKIQTMRERIDAQIDLRLIIFEKVLNNSLFINIGFRDFQHWSFFLWPKWYLNARCPVPCLDPGRAVQACFFFFPSE